MFKNYTMVRTVQLCRYTEIIHFKKINFTVYLKMKLFNKKERQKTSVCGLREGQG